MKLIFLLNAEKSGALRISLTLNGAGDTPHTVYTTSEFDPSDEQPEECFNGRRETHKRFFDSALFFTSHSDSMLCSSLRVGSGWLLLAAAMMCKQATQGRLCL